MFYGFSACFEDRNFDMWPMAQSNLGPDFLYDNARVLLVVIGETEFMEHFFAITICVYYFFYVIFGKRNSFNNVENFFNANGFLPWSSSWISFFFWARDRKNKIRIWDKADHFCFYQKS